jgi:DNA-binding GntR family transcriptional regulator
MMRRANPSTLDNGLRLSDEAFSTLSQHVSNFIRDSIRQGTFRPAERLVESQIATQLSVSRGPIREALKQLEHEGLVTILPRRGAVVNRLAKSDVREIASLRGVIEGLAARILAERRDLRAADSMEIILREMARIGDTNPVQFATLDWQFHDTLCLSPGHKRLHQVWNNLRTQIWMYIREIRLGMLFSIDQAIQIHQAIVDVIRAGDAIEAERLARSHSEIAVQQLESHLTE